MAFKTVMKKMLFAAVLTVAAGAAADDADPMAACDNSYAACNGRCDAMENATSECYDGCDNHYRSCLDRANGYTPEPETKSEQKTPASKTPKKSDKPLEGQDEGTDPDGAGHNE